MIVADDVAGAVVQTDTDTLTRADRCDRCGSQAYFKVEFISGELVFCNHHYSWHKEKLMKTALSIYDESHKLQK